MICFVDSLYICVVRFSQEVAYKLAYFTQLIVSVQTQLLRLTGFFVHYSEYSYLCLLIIGLLCLWVYATRVCDTDHCHGMCDNCGDIFLAECRELSLAMDFILRCCFNCSLCLLLRRILLLCED